MKLLCTGDIHLGAGARLGRHPGDRLEDQRQVLTQIAALACLREVDAVLVAGDVFEGPLITPEQLDVFAQFVGILNEVEIQIVAVSGNGMHDAAMRPVNGVAIFDHVPGVSVYSRPAVHHLAAGSIACMPWVSPGRLIAKEGPDVDRDRINQHAAELLISVASGLKAKAEWGPTVLMVHASISGASLPTGISTDDLREPVLPVDELLDLGYAAVVASHIHVPQIRTTGEPWTQPKVEDIGEPWLNAWPLALYTGSPMPLNFGETNVPHGVWILNVSGDDTTAEFVPIESRNLLRIDLDPGDGDHGVAWPEMWDGSLEDAIVKVAIHATRSEHRRLDLGQIREAILTAGAHTVKIETETIREDRARVDGVTEDLDPLDAFDAWAAANDVVTTLVTPARERMEQDLEAVGA